MLVNRTWSAFVLLSFALGTCAFLAAVPPSAPVCPRGTKCVPHIQCTAHFAATKQDASVIQACSLANGDRGLCCMSGRDLAASVNMSEAMLGSSFGPTNDLRPLMLEARRHYASLMAQEPRLAAIRVDKGVPEDFHNAVFKSDSVDELSKNHMAMEQILASRLLLGSYPSTDKTKQIDPLVGNLLGTGTCIENPPCKYEKKYRTEDGTCNNELKSLWGSAGYPMERLLPPAYEDGVWAPRLRGHNEAVLPSPRVISLSLCPDVHRTHDKYNLMVMQFGQLVAHDVTQSSSIKLQDGADVQCCTKDGSGPLPKSVRHFGCLPISLPKDDPFFKNYHQGCMNFVRSALGPNPDCKLGYGRQLTKVTHYLDASVIYGSSKKTFGEVRSFEGGKLRSFNDNGREHLPLTDAEDACLFMEAGNSCYFAGDARVNQIISVTALHVVFLREHNSIASGLAHLNPHWNDETLFQETRRIVSAVFQHITYNEYLPVILGQSLAEKFGLLPLYEGWANVYDPYVNPSITNEFSGAAFRFGHSSVDGRFLIPNHGMVRIPDVMFNPGRMRLDFFHDAMIQTLTHQPMQRVDSSVSKGLTQHLFQGTKPFGLDLVALNIQRGRDYGLRPYNDYLYLTGSKTVDSFSDFGFEIGNTLSQVYKHPHDVDLFVGGILEKTERDAVVGPTFGEIIADQFSKFKKGDRYYYENGPDVNPGYFTPAQLEVIRQQTLARLICSNADRIALFEMSPHAFWRADYPGNEPIDCKSGYYRDIDLRPWQT